MTLSIKQKLIIALLGISMFPLGILGTINYFKTADIFTKSIQTFLLEIVRSKQDLLESYIETTESAARSMAETDVFQEYISLEKDGVSSEDNLRLKTVTKLVENMLYSFQKIHWGQYHHIFLIDKSYKIVISPNYGKEVKGSPSSHLNEDTSKNKWVYMTLTQGITTVSDFSSWKESDHNHQMLFFPIKDASGKTQAALGFELQIPHEQKILSKNLKLGETGKVFLTTTRGEPIVYRGMKDQTPMITQGIVEVQRTGFSSGLRQNSKGVKVIDLYLKNKKYPWIIVAEIEAKEAFQSLKAIRISMTVFTIITLLIVVFLALVSTNLLITPIEHLTKKMKEVSMGNLNVQIDGIQRKDEIGKLVRAFNRVVKSLKIAMKNYQKDEIA